MAKIKNAIKNNYFLVYLLCATLTMGPVGLAKSLKIEHPVAKSEDRIPLGNGCYFFFLFIVCQPESGNEGRQTTLRTQTNQTPTSQTTSRNDESTTTTTTEIVTTNAPSPTDPETAEPEPTTLETEEPSTEPMETEEPPTEAPPEESSAEAEASE